jgi:hypothetical protein
MRRFLRFLAVGLGLGAASLPAVAGTHWMCGLSQEGVRLVCVADPDDMADADPAKPAPGQGAVVRGTRFPLDASDVYTVELWSVPDDAQWLEQLARATICFRSPGCTVSVAPVQGLDVRHGTVVAARWR